MQECGVCGLLFLGNEGCPSCGSQIATRVLIDSTGIDEGEIIPGLEEAVEAIGPGVDVSKPKPQHSLPFGMGAQVEVIESNLPFGVGSMTSKIEKLVDDSISTEIIQEEPVPIIEEIIQEVHDEPVPEEEPIKYVELPPVKVEEIPVEIQNVPPMEEEIEIHSKPLEEIPNMWKIEAAPVDFDQIYSQEEEVVEVTFADEYSTDDVMVEFDDFHHESTEPSVFQIEESTPKLHPARALVVDFAGDTDLETRVRSSFEHMSDGSWMQAAQELSAANRANPNDPPLLNNLGLALLQNALEMDSDNDPLADTQYEAAIMSLRQAAKIDTSSDVILTNLAHALLVSGRTEKALGVIKVVAARNPENPESANIQGSCFLQMGQIDDAKRIFSAYANDEYCSSNLALI